jgi:hypothetical protein
VETQRGLVRRRLIQAGRQTADQTFVANRFQVTVVTGSGDVTGETAHISLDGLVATFHSRTKLPIGQLLRLRVALPDGGQHPLECFGWVPKSAAVNTAQGTHGIQFYALPKNDGQRWTSYYHRAIKHRV